MSASESFSLDEVVDALRGLLDVVERDGDDLPPGRDFCTGEEWDAALDKARAVLAKVEGE